MITTITTTTTTTVVILQQAAMLTAISVVVLVVLLTANELINSAQDKVKLSSLVRRLNIVTLPCLFAFVMVIAMKIWEVL